MNVVITLLKFFLLPLPSLSFPSPSLIYLSLAYWSMFNIFFVKCRFNSLLVGIWGLANLGIWYKHYQIGKVFGSNSIFICSLWMLCCISDSKKATIISVSKENTAVSFTITILCLKPFVLIWTRICEHVRGHYKYNNMLNLFDSSAPLANDVLYDSAIC